MRRFLSHAAFYFAIFSGIVVLDVAVAYFGELPSPGLSSLTGRLTMAGFVIGGSIACAAIKMFFELRASR